MEKFEVGKMYSWADRSYDPFTVLSRTEKTITVRNNSVQWKMLIHTDEHGEYVCDSSMPKRVRSMFTSRPTYITH